MTKTWIFFDKLYYGLYCSCFDFIWWLVFIIFYS